MNYYSDPTASAALGNIGRELSRHEKEAKKLLKLFQAGKISRDEIDELFETYYGMSVSDYMVDALKEFGVSDMLLMVEIDEHQSRRPSAQALDLVLVQLCSDRDVLFDLRDLLRRQSEVVLKRKEPMHPSAL